MRSQELFIADNDDCFEYFDPNRFVELGLTITKSGEYINGGA